jgi:Na+-driven multidrug efflux pump
MSGGRPAASRDGGAGVCADLRLAGEQIIALLTSLPSLQQLADRYLIWQMILPVVGVWCYLLDGMFIGATRGRRCATAWRSRRRGLP